MSTSTVEQYMSKALELARQGEGRTRPNPPVGALVVRNGEIVGEGFHERAGEPHAEIHALRQAGDQAQGADLYVTLEPCAHQGRTGPCTEAVIAAGIRRVFVGCQDPNPQVAGRGIARLRAAGLEVVEDVLTDECRWLIGPFACHVTTGRPLVILKAAMTLDGRIAPRQGDSKWISNPASRMHTHEVRHRLDAIMVGVGTVERDNPLLTTRLERGGRDALRVVVDSTLRIPDQAKILLVQSESPTVIATTTHAPYGKIRRLRDMGVRVLVLPDKDRQVDLLAMLVALGGMGIQSILLEGGTTLNSSFFAERLIDRVMIFIAPRLIGGDEGKGIFAGAGVATLNEAPSIRCPRISRYGDDLLYEGEVSYVHRTD